MKKLTLSDAILKGCKMRPRQETSGRFYGDGSSCSLGAAADAVGHKGALTFEYLESRFPELVGWKLKNCAANNDYLRWGIVPLSVALIMLNDIYKWPREKQAYWLKSHGL